MNDIGKAMSQDETIRAIYQELDEMTLPKLLHLWPIWKEEMYRLGIKESARALMARLMQYCIKQKEVEQCGLPQM